MHKIIIILKELLKFTKVTMKRIEIDRKSTSPGYKVLRSLANIEENIFLSFYIRTQE